MFIITRNCLILIYIVEKRYVEIRGIAKIYNKKAITNTPINFSIHLQGV